MCEGVELSRNALVSKGQILNHVTHLYLNSCVRMAKFFSGHHACHGPTTIDRQSSEDNCINLSMDLLTALLEWRRGLHSPVQAP